MRVCMLAYSFYESDMRILRYARTLVDRGDSVDVIALGREGAARVETLDGVNVYRVQGRERNERNWFDYLVRVLRFMFISSLTIARKHFEQPYDVVHVHSVPDFLVFAAIIPRISGARIILDIHDILPEFFASKFGATPRSVRFRLLLFAERLSARFSHHVIIANDLWSERLIARSVPASRCSTIINYPDATLFYRRPRTLRKDPTRFRMIYPGTLNAHQGVDIAVRAVALLRRQIPALEFHIYGEGPEKPALLALSAALGCDGCIRFHDFLPCHEIADSMALADLSVVPKRASSPFGNEAMSTKIMEFMALGIPVIAANTRVDRHYHDDSRVRFFDSENVASLAAAIRDLYGDGEKRTELARNGQLYVEAHSWSHKKGMYLGLVDRLCSANRSLTASVNDMEAS